MCSIFVLKLILQLYYKTITSVLTIFLGQPNLKGNTFEDWKLVDQKTLLGLIQTSDWRGTRTRFSDFVRLVASLDSTAKINESYVMHAY